MLLLLLLLFAALALLGAGPLLGVTLLLVFCGQGGGAFGQRKLLGFLGTLPLTIRGNGLFFPVWLLLLVVWMIPVRPNRGGEERMRRRMMMRRWWCRRRNHGHDDTGVPGPGIDQGCLGGSRIRKWRCIGASGWCHGGNGRIPPALRLHLLFAVL